MSKNIVRTTDEFKQALLEFEVAISKFRLAEHCLRLTNRDSIKAIPEPVRLELVNKASDIQRILLSQPIL